MQVAGLYRFLKQHPDLVVSRAEPVTVAGLDGLRFDETVRFSKPAREAAFCRTQLMVCTLIGPTRFFRTGCGCTRSCCRSAARHS